MTNAGKDIRGRLSATSPIHLTEETTRSGSEGGVASSGGGAALAPGYYRADLQPAGATPPPILSRIPEDGVRRA